MVKEDGLYTVRLKDNAQVEAWWISRKEIWVTPDGAETIEGVIAWQKNHQL